MQRPRATLLVFAIAIPLAASAAAQRLVPTTVRGSDCTAVQITASNPPSATFFTDHCAGPNEPVFISLDGTEYPLLRSEGSYQAFPFQGKFVAKGLVVVVKPIRLLSREPRPKSPDAKDDYRPSKFEVLVTVSTGKATKSIKATMSQ